MLKSASIGLEIMSSSRERETIVGVGTNIGDRRENILVMAGHLDTLVHGLEFSPVFETRPVGAGTRNPYFNCICRFRWRSGPYDLLRVLQGIESTMGRERRNRWGNRIMDLDILIMEGVRLCNSSLTIPHPRYRFRSFVLLPLYAFLREKTLPEIEKGIHPYLTHIESTGWRRVFDPPTKRRGAWDMIQPGIS